jgi:hypothetical protein
MKVMNIGKVLQAAACLLCAAVAWKFSVVGLVGTEFSGGRLTGPLLTLSISGFGVFVLTLILTFMFQRLAAIGALVASLLCLPLYFYFLVPGFVQRMIPGDYSVHVQGIFVWNGWAFLGMLTLAIVVYLSLHSVTANRVKVGNGV